MKLIQTFIIELKSLIISKIKKVLTVDSKLSLKKYLNYLKRSNFVVCPLGNGPDTHRIWETLYAGSVPITFLDPQISALENLPYIYFPKLDNFLEKNIKQYDFDIKVESDKLNINWWVLKINQTRIESNEVFKLDFTENIDEVISTYLKN